MTAIAAVNDLAAVGAMAAVADAGLRVPSDVAVTGYDDTFIAAIRQVSLTSVNPDSSGIGTQAAHCVLRRIEDPGRAVEEHLLPPRLVTRFSSGVPAGGFGAVAPGPELVNNANLDHQSDTSHRQFPAGGEILELSTPGTCVNSLVHPVESPLSILV